jgi:O-antigen/teichoic acid export membrane protein
MAGEGAGQASSLILFLLLARIVSKESFGVIAFSLATIEFVRNLVIEPIALAVTAKPEVSSEDYDVSFTLSLILSLLLAATLCLLAPLIAHLIGGPDSVTALRALSLLIIGLGVMRTHGAWLARNMMFRILAIRSIAAVAAGGIVGLSLAASGFDVWSLIGQQLAICATSVVLIWSATPWRPRLIFSWSKSQGILRQAVQISFGSIWSALGKDADVFLASAFLGPVIVGVYSVAKRILVAANLVLVNGISAVTLPAFAKLAAGDEKSLAFLRSSSLASAFTAPAFAGLAVMAPDLINVALGERWEAAAAPLTAMSFTGYVLSLSQFMTAILLVEQKPRLEIYSSVVQTVATILFILLAVRFGPAPLAFAVFLGASLAFPLRTRFALKILNIRQQQLFAVLLPSLASAILMAVTIAILRWKVGWSEEPVKSLACFVTLGAGIYIIFLRLLGPSVFKNLVAGTHDVLRLNRLTPRLKALQTALHLFRKRFRFATIPRKS